MTEIALPSGKLSAHLLRRLLAPFRKDASELY
jgi:hypothetical protein